MLKSKHYRALTRECGCGSCRPISFTEALYLDQINLDCQAVDYFYTTHGCDVDVIVPPLCERYMMSYSYLMKLHSSFKNYRNILGSLGLGGLISALVHEYGYANVFDDIVRFLIFKLMDQTGSFLSGDDRKELRALLSSFSFALETLLHGAKLDIPPYVRDAFFSCNYAAFVSSIKTLYYYFLRDSCPPCVDLTHPSVSATLDLWGFVFHIEDQPVSVMKPEDYLPATRYVTDVARIMRAAIDEAHSNGVDIYSILISRKDDEISPASVEVSGVVDSIQNSIDARSLVTSSGNCYVKHDNEVFHERSFQTFSYFTDPSAQFLPEDSGEVYWHDKYYGRASSVDNHILRRFLDGSFLASYRMVYRHTSTGVRYLPPLALIVFDGICSLLPAMLRVVCGKHVPIYVVQDVEFDVVSGEWNSHQADPNIHVISCQEALSLLHFTKCGDDLCDARCGQCAKPVFEEESVLWYEDDPNANSFIIFNAGYFSASAWHDEEHGFAQPTLFYTDYVRGWISAGEARRSDYFEDMMYDPVHDSHFFFESFHLGYLSSPYKKWASFALSDLGLKTLCLELRLSDLDRRNGSVTLLAEKAFAFFCDKITRLRLLLDGKGVAGLLPCKRCVPGRDRNEKVLARVGCACGRKGMIGRRGDAFLSRRRCCCRCGDGFCSGKGQCSPYYAKTTSYYKYGIGKEVQGDFDLLV